MVFNALYTSNSEEWETPQWLFDKLNAKFKFTLDVCATKENAKCVKYYDKNIDGLKQSWLNEICWLNPPYGKTIALWMEKAYTTRLNCGTVVALVPVRTDTKWGYDYCVNTDVWLLKGRLHFSNSKNPAPFPSAIVIFTSYNIFHGEYFNVDLKLEM